MTPHRRVYGRARNAGTERNSRIEREEVEDVVVLLATWRTGTAVAYFPKIIPAMCRAEPRQGEFLRQSAWQFRERRRDVKQHPVSEQAARRIRVVEDDGITLDRVGGWIVPGKWRGAVETVAGELRRNCGAAGERLAGEVQRYDGRRSVRVASAAAADHGDGHDGGNEQRAHTTAASAAARMRDVSASTSAFQPDSTVSTHSVSRRSVMHGTPAQ